MKKLLLILLLIPSFAFASAYSGSGTTTGVMTLSKINSSPLLVWHKLSCSFTGSVTALTVDLEDEETGTQLGQLVFSAGGISAGKESYYIYDAPTEKAQINVTTQTGAGTVTCTVKSR